MECHVVHAADVGTTDKDRRRKTDSVDAKKLAIALQHGTLEGIYVPNPKQREDRALLRRYRQVSKDLARAKNRIQSTLAFHGVTQLQKEAGSAWSKVYLNRLKGLTWAEKGSEAMWESLLRDFDTCHTEKLSLKRSIKMISEQSYYLKTRDCLMSLPGLSLIGVMTLITELGISIDLIHWISSAAISVWYRAVAAAARRPLRRGLTIGGTRSFDGS